MTLATQAACTGCSACASICPRCAIAMKSNSEGFLRPSIDSSRCIECGLCRKTCPVLMITQKNHDMPECFAFKTKNRELLQTSSSGGAFTSIAMPVIRAGGTVFGCVMEKPDFTAHHVMAENEAELAPMRGSKYVQSDIRGAFKKCKSELERGRQILFSGTSCQIAGLKAFLGKGYANLLTVDFICHGVPSPAVWRKYIDRCQNRAKSKISCISFRNKYYSWEKFSLSLSYDNDKLNSITPLDQDTYFKCYLGNYCLRRSCAACMFKPGKGAVSDITIADFWGIKEVRPSFFDEHGVSAVVIHTTKGKQAFNCSKSNAEVIPVSLNEITLHNPSYAISVVLPKGRNLFMRYFRHVCSLELLLAIAKRYPFGAWFMSYLVRKANNALGKI